MGFLEFMASILQGPILLHTSTLSHEGGVKDGGGDDPVKIYHFHGKHISKHI